MVGKIYKDLNKGTYMKIWNLLVLSVVVLLVFVSGCTSKEKLSEQEVEDIGKSAMQSAGIPLENYGFHCFENQAGSFSCLTDYDVLKKIPMCGIKVTFSGEIEQQPFCFGCDDERYDLGFCKENKGCECMNS